MGMGRTDWGLGVAIAEWALVDPTVTIRTAGARRKLPIVADNANGYGHDTAVDPLSTVVVALDAWIYCCSEVPGSAFGASAQER